MSVRLACPYCNAAVVTDVPQGGRATCPRCGEGFAVKGGEVVGASGLRERAGGSACHFPSREPPGCGG